MPIAEGLISMSFSSPHRQRVRQLVQPCRFVKQCHDPSSRIGKLSITGYDFTHCACGEADRSKYSGWLPAVALCTMHKASIPLRLGPLLARLSQMHGKS